MPVNITSGNRAKFVVEFISSATGGRASPSSASVTLTYYVGGTLNSSTMTLSQVGGFWTGTWDSTGVDLGTVSYTTASSATTNPASTGELRIID